MLTFLSTIVFDEIMKKTWCKHHGNFNILSIYDGKIASAHWPDARMKIDKLDNSKNIGYEMNIKNENEIQQTPMT